MSFNGMLRYLMIAVLSLAEPTNTLAQTRRTSQPLTIQQLWSLDKTFTDREHGITFRYPSVWKSGTTFGYIPPWIEGMQPDERISGVSYVVDGWPRDKTLGPYAKTTLEGVGFGYSVIRAKNVLECEAMAQSQSKDLKRSVTINGRVYSSHVIGGVAAGHSIDGMLYATYAFGSCFLFESTIGNVLASLPDRVLLPPKVQHFMESKLLNMMQTVRIAPK